MAALEHEASLGPGLCVIAASEGGWVEIVEAHGRPPESRELVGYFVLHGRDRSLLAPIVWPQATQLDLARFLAGHPVRDIVELAAELKVDLLVIGATGHSGLYERMIGSRADRIIQLAPCPVLVVK